MKDTCEQRHPIQPVGFDGKDFLFKKNAIVKYLMTNSGLSLTDIAGWDAPDEDLQQFAQLVGLSLNEFAELPFASKEIVGIAQRMEQGQSEEQAIIAAQKAEIERLRNGMIKLLADAHGFKMIDPRT